MRPILASQGFSQQDADILATLARHVLIARSNATKFAMRRDLNNPLCGLPSKLSTADTLRSLQFKLKEALGVQSATVRALLWCCLQKCLAG
jgi:hypothetical protein